MSQHILPDSELQEAQKLFRQPLIPETISIIIRSPAAREAFTAWNLYRSDSKNKWQRKMIRREDWEIAEAKVIEAIRLFLSNGTITFPPFMQPMKRVLFVYASPGFDNLNPRFDREIKMIDEALIKSRYRDHFELKPCPQIMLSEFNLRVAEFQPHLIHVAMHANQTIGLLFSNDENMEAAITAEQFARNLELLLQQCPIEGVIFNCCHSMQHAEEASKLINFSIGMQGPIPDETCQLFSQGFYQMYFDHKPFDFSVSAGVLAVENSSKPAIKNSSKQIQFFKKPEPQ
ncbi:MAG TPA: hypothetical protein VE978_10970 [Chitinophagales bacterium]|nr:hypothetical protein [Chitinophagales bacterium]